MRKQIKYYSTDKVYSIKDDIIKSYPKAICVFLFVVSSLLLIIAALMFIGSFKFNTSVEKISYGINGRSDYTVYLKDNNYYETKFLNSGMQYVASLIETINTNFNYEVHASGELGLDYNYKIVGTLKVFDKENVGKILYTKSYDLTESKTGTINSNNLVINTDVNLDYGLYNEYVGSYLSEYGLLAEAEMEVALILDVNGNVDNTDHKIAEGKVMTITIPLSEQTIDITINNSSISDSNHIFDTTKYTITNTAVFIGSVCVLIFTLYLLVLSTNLTKKYISDNIYNITLNKILKEYDRIIVNGNVTIDESKFSNKVYVDSFEELVDASQAFNEPILFYNAIPGEKCFFIIVKGDTLYKKRLTKAFLEKKLMAKGKGCKDLTEEIRKTKK